MIGFLVKKTFFDLWDNMFRIVLVNLGFIVSLGITVLLPELISLTPLSIAVRIIGIQWCCVYLAATALSVKAISDYGSFGFADFFRNLKAGLPAGMVLGLAALFLFIMARFTIPFYWTMDSIFGWITGGIIVWTLALSLVSFQFFCAIRARLDTKPLKIIKKCFIIFFDNTGFSLFTFLYTVVTLALSLMLALLLPGPAGLLLFLDEALRLRLLKYDWLEENPPAENTPKRRVIPWDVLLIEERDRTGTRTFRNFIFPWKE